MADPSRWNERYEKGETPWDTGRPSGELQRRVAEVSIPPGRAIDLGCGTGASAVWLAQQGFEVTALDLSSKAIEQARQRADAAGARLHLLTGDILRPPETLIGPFDFIFDRGCYHVVRREDVGAYLDTLRWLCGPRTLGLILAGNAREPHDPGPPVVTEEEMRKELGAVFAILDLREFRFDQVETDGTRHLGWSCLVRRRGT